MMLMAAPKSMFEELMTPDNSHYIKPSTEAFVEGAQRLEVDPEDCLFIDDSQANIDGAVAAGMQGLFFENTESTIQFIRERLS
jgi:HAD superfamily hydrolase (TIGR01509 family)